MAIAGHDPMEFLKNEDPIEVIAAQAVARRVRQLKDERDEARAVRIANAVGKMFSGG